ncbi:Lipid A export ATP-binding/permease protein MsbA [Acidisarcina polymorpha]|uniref:Lipid A export ATP-binding/permease protein MsbA n=1 Tax=Acidisarcina polymorpha TaxID=2211140 RepID=A0A2Z5FZE8_9BACT|nr:ABC transporter ATP-binding protein [Acidisarcina polymorpha]AXC11785.1 Lipid A export ATP-binding/permease protein MsbA [Acidisarcina polymorpha]
MLRFVGGLVRPYRGTLLAILAAMLLETAMSLATPWPLKIILDNVVEDHKLAPWLRHLIGPLLDSGARLHVAALAAASFVIIALIGAVASYLDNYYTESVGQWVAHDLRVRTYHHLQRLSLGYYNTHETGTILSTITADIQTIQGFASSSTLDILVDLLTIVCMLGLMFWLNWDFTLIALAVTPFLLLFVSRFKKAVKKATHEVRKEQSEILAVVQQGLESMQVVKAFGQEQNQEDLLAGVSHATVAAALKARSIKSLLSPVVTITVALCTAVVLWRGAALILHGAMTIGELTVYLAYLAKFFKPVKDLATTTNAVAQAAVGAERIRTILDTNETIPEKPDGLAPETLGGAIEFKHVAFGYDSAVPILKDVSFKIEPGQFVGLVGPTGSGKSTILSLIPRFYDVQSGAVYVDGRDVRDYLLKPLRDQIGYVLQDTLLFHGTILENIAFGRPHASQEEVVAAARLAHADEFISRMPLGYQTMVGERGCTLSGGQRQRIGIARVMVRNSPILILDEPTAALDSESEKLVIDALERLMKGRTVIMIAHRLSTIRNADQIIVISGGMVAEHGTHDALMALHGVYASLHRTQFDAEPSRVRVESVLPVLGSGSV